MEFKKLIHPEIVEITKEELVKFELKWILHNLMSPNDTELYVLAYVYLYKRDAIDKMVEDGIVKNTKTVENYISKFRRKSLIIGTGNKTQLHPKITPVVHDLEYTIKFKLKEESND